MWIRCLNWWDERTGWRGWTARRLPNGPSWGHALGAVLVWLGVVEVATGLLLMTSFSPSTTSAWASVHSIDQTPGGPFLRGLHYFGGQALIVLFALYMLRSLLTASYRAPRELAWISGLLILPLLVVWTLTGSLMTGTQTAHGQLTVEGNILGSLPLVGGAMKRILLGGSEIGNLTLTHLHALHVGLLPLVVGLLAWLHFAQLRRRGHAWSAPPEESDTGAALLYWPNQSIRNATLFTLAFAAIIAMAWQWGAPLDAPADPELAEHLDPRPEWYFTFLFKLRFFFTGPYEAVVTMSIPLLVLLVLILLPWLDRWLPRAAGATLRVAVALVCVAGWTALTFVSLYTDANDESFQQKRTLAETWSERAQLLADYQPIPPCGPSTLLRNDPKTFGPLLFARHCASCHPYYDRTLAEKQEIYPITTKQPTAANLFGFATPAWIAGLLDPEQIASEHYFGATEFAEGDMVGFVVDNISDSEEDDPLMNSADAKLVAHALSAEANLPSQADAKGPSEEQLSEGRELIVDNCTECHHFGDEGELGEAPDLTGYGSREWLIGMISSPEHERFYGEKNDRMPSFAANPDDPEQNLLDQHSIELIADWLRGDWFEPQRDSAKAPGKGADKMPEDAKPKQ